MELLMDIELFSGWLLEYGSIVLFFLLALGIIAFPIPEETLLVISGILIQSGHLYPVETIIAALGGSLFGISTSYYVGTKAGHFFLQRASKWFGIKEHHFDQAHAWFEKFGKWTLFFGYFIPGVRHFTGFCAGMAALEFRHFALFAYSGAIVWVSTFLSVGYFFGNYGLAFFNSLEIRDQQILYAIAILVIVSLVFFFVRSRKKA
jgi:membrane protein DedA with SNARE-associated domain